MRALEKLALEVFILDAYHAFLQRRVHMPFDELPGGRKPSVKVDRADDRFERVGQYRIHPFALRLGRARAHEYIIPQLHIVCVDAESFTVDKP